MPCPSEEFSGSKSERVRFQNWLGNVNVLVDHFFQPDSRAALVWLVQQASRLGRRLHVVGSGWSFEDNMASEDWMVCIDRLNKINTEVLDVSRGAYSALDPFWARRVSGAGSDVHLVHVEAGIRLFELNNALHSRGYAMRSLGGSQGQSLAGAFSTSTHGGDLNEPPVADFVRAIHLITHDGQEIWIESSSQALTQDAQFRERLIPTHACTDIEIIRDDDLLYAVQVSVGRFGVIYAVVVEVRSWFNLLEWTVPSSWGEVSALLRQGIDENRGLGPLLAGLPQPNSARFRDIALDPRDHLPKTHYLEFLFNSRSDNGLFVRRRWETTSVDHSLLSGAGGRRDFIDEPGVANFVLMLAAFTIRGSILSVVGIPGYGLIRSLEMEIRAAELDIMALDPHVRVNQAMVAAINALWASDEYGIFGAVINEISHAVFNGRSEVARAANGYRGVSWQVMSGVSPDAGDTKVNSIEIVFSTLDPNYLSFISFLLAEGQNYRQSGYIAVRYSATSDALLSMHNYESNHAVSIEVASLEGFEHNRQWMYMIEARALELGGRPHWGQHNNLQSYHVSRLYAGNLARWRDQLLRVCSTTSTFSNNYTEQRGLEARYIIRDVTHVIRAHGRITHLCNPEAHWSPMPVEEVINMFESIHSVNVGGSAFPPALGNVNYQTRPTNPDIPPALIIIQHVLSTTPDEFYGNNLTALPGKSAQYASDPPVADVRREITSVVRNRYHGVEYLNNDTGNWSVFDRIAFQEIKAGTRSYFVRDPTSGTEADLQAKTYLATFGDGREENNLNVLPEF